VDVDQPVELLLRRLLDGRIVAVAGIVDEVIEAVALPATAKGAKAAMSPTSSCRAMALRPIASISDTTACASSTRLW